MFRVMDVAAGEKKDLDLLGSCCVDLNFYFLFNMLRRPIAASTTPTSSLIPAEIQVSDHPCQRLTPRARLRARTAPLSSSQQQPPTAAALRHVAQFFARPSARAVAAATCALRRGRSSLLG